MVSAKSVEKQLKRIGFKKHGWGKGEIDELHHILLPEEEIYECVNGIYEGGFALLLATDVRVLLVDKKPLNFLTVEDLRFEMINELDYSHRLLGAQINIASGNKSLHFRSYNQPRLRKLITHVQHCMAEAKKKVSTHQEGQNLHLEQINQQLQAYLIAQYNQQQQLQEIRAAQQAGLDAPPMPEPIRPSNELSDYLLAQRLLAEHQQQQGRAGEAELVGPIQMQQPQPVATASPARHQPQMNNNTQLDEMYEESMQEVFGKHVQREASAAPATNETQPVTQHMRIAYSKLPMALRNRKFGRHSLFPT